MVFLLVLIILAATGVALALSTDHWPPRIPIGSWQPHRLVTYVLAFAALLAMLFALATLLAIGAALLTGQVGDTMSSEEARNRASLAAAALLVGVPLWMVFWDAAKRRLDRSPADQGAVERRLFFAAIFAVTSIVVLFAVQSVLLAVFTLPAPAHEHPSVMRGIDDASSLVVFGAAWVVFARLGWRERKPQGTDALHDVAVMALAFFSLCFLWNGNFEALYRVVANLVGLHPYDTWSGPARSSWAIWGGIASWAIWGGIASWVTSGGAIWTAVLRYDLARGGRRLVRVVYLYVVALLAAAIAVTAGTTTSFELLRRLLGYAPGPGRGMWWFLAPDLPWLLSAGLVWLAHWLLLRVQASLNGVPAAIPGEIPWPRRPALAVDAFAGLAMLATGMLIMIWVALDALCGTGITFAGSAWWRDRLCAGLATAAVGLALWLPAWLLLQHAAATAPTQERPARSRRVLLSTIVIAGSLAALGYGVAMLWLLIRVMLGDGLDSETVARVLQYLSTVVITGALATAHGVELRNDLRWQGRHSRTLPLFVLVEDGAGELLPALASLPDVAIRVEGRVHEAQILPGQDFHALASRIAELPERDRLKGVVLVLGRATSVLYPYTD